MQVDALLHGPSLPTGGVPARVAFLGDRLHIAHGATVEEVAADRLTVGITGFNEDTLQLTWEQGGAIQAITLTDPAARRELLEQAPAGFAPRLKAGQSTLHWHRRKWNTVIGIITGFALLLVIAWWQSEAITAWAANRVSLETEIDIGNNALEQLKTEHELTQEGAGAQAIADIGARLTKGSRYQYRWYVSDDKEINAYALPGGIVVVNAGMIAAADNAEELAGVLAHEVQHVEHRHTLQQMIHTAGWAAVLAVVLGDVSAITAVVLHQLGNLRNSRKLEKQADDDGMKALAAAGIPLDGMVALFRKLEDEEGRRGGPGIPLLQSHPTTEERIRDLEQLAGALHCQCHRLDIDWPAVQSSVDAWRKAA